MSVEFSLWILGFFAFVMAAYGILRYRTPLNPLTIFMGYDIGLITLLSGVIAYTMLPIKTYTQEDMVKTAMISIVYLLGVSLPFFFSGSLTIKFFSFFMDFFRLRSTHIATVFSSSKFILLLFGVAGSFIALAVVGGGGLLWLTNSREAYITYRAGAGPFFALIQWFLTFAFIYYLWSNKPRGLKLLFVSGLFGIAAYFMGSKNNIIILLFIGVVYYNFYVKRLSFINFFLLMPLLLMAVFGLLFVQGSYASLLEAPLYFQDYFDTTTQFISRFDEFGFQYGQGWLSSLWFYVPRSIYPNKPYEYGIVLIHQVLFPGAAALGNTPGILLWALDYLDFGVYGVFVAGFVKGLWQKMSYEYFLMNKDSFFAFVFMMQFSLLPILTFAPLVFVIALSIGFSIFFRLVWHRKSHPTQTIAKGENRI
ncbi:hypothetical protein KJ656_12060 [bacterium]|nr:hypothetical protein [bacterium]